MARDIRNQGLTYSCQWSFTQSSRFCVFRLYYHCHSHFTSRHTASAWQYSGGHSPSLLDSYTSPSILLSLSLLSDRISIWSVSSMLSSLLSNRLSVSLSVVLSLLSSISRRCLSCRDQAIASRRGLERAVVNQQEEVKRSNDLHKNLTIGRKRNGEERVLLGQIEERGR